MNRLLTLWALGLTTPAAWAQQTALDEDFESGVFPPAGWTEINNGATAGWELDLAGEEAEHDDYVAGLANDNRLETPPLDLTALTQVYLHATQDQVFPNFRDVNAVEVTLDGGLTYTTLYQENGVDPWSDVPLELDLSAYAGLSGVQISFRYVGEYANVWRLDDVVVDDVPPPPPPAYWGELPTSFVAAAGYRENFEAMQGVPPAHMRLNALSAASRLPDPEAWCNVGQQAPCLLPYDGQYALEMGLQPGSVSYHRVANAMILGLDGSGATDFRLSFQAINYGEEPDADDGVFVSVDGVQWVPVATDWSSLVGSLSSYDLVHTDLSLSGLDLSGQFYLLIAQTDDFPFGDLDGIGVDNLALGLPLLEAFGVIAGQQATFTVTGVDPASRVILAYSLLPGPTNTIYGDADLGSPYEQLGSYPPDASGVMSTNIFIPSAAAGRTIWLQGLELLGAEGRFTNGLRLEVL